MADDLHALLKSSDIRPPVIIAGHSMGGLVARAFTSRYPGEVAGMLLIDSSHEDQVRRLGPRPGTRSALRAARRQARILGARRLASSAGRLAETNPARLARLTVPEYVSASRAVTLSSKQRRITVRELVLLSRPHGQPRDLGSLPLTVLTAASPHRREWSEWPQWAALQDELAALSYDAVHIAALNADHNVHLDDPGIVIREIRELLKRCR